MCCENHAEVEAKDENGECQACGAGTVDGKAHDICAYSPDDPCELCGSNPCNQFC